MKRHRPIARPFGEAKGDRGAAFLELALIVPILTLLALGVVEYGMGWKTANDVNAAARDGARVGSSAAMAREADFQIFSQIAFALSAKDVNNLERVIVYKADSADGDVPPECLSAPYDNGSIPLGVDGKCNVYNWGQFVAARRVADDCEPDDEECLERLKTAFSGRDRPCSNSVWDAKWCPADRERSLSHGVFLGVYVELEKPSVTNAGFGDQTVTRKAVFRLEPDLSAE